MAPAGTLDRRLRFEARAAPVSDGYGNTVSGDWMSRFTVAAGVKYLKGSETVLAARLEGRQPAIITIRSSSSASLVTHEWRAVDERNGQVFAIKEPPRADGHGFIEILAESGVAA